MNKSQNPEKSASKTFELVGPNEYSYREVVEFVMDVTTTKKPLIEIPISAAKFVGNFFEQTITPFITADLVEQMTVDIVATKDPNVLTLSDLGIQATSMDKQAFDYLHRFRPGGHFITVQGYH